MTGKVVAGPFEGHTEAVFGISFFSDGKQIAGSEGSTIRGCDMQTGDVLIGPLSGDGWTVISVAFSEMDNE